MPALRDLGRTDLTITDLYDNSSYAGEYVTLTGLIATTSTTSDGHYFFVQAPGGGSRSGMMVDLRGDTTDVALGDELSITAYVGAVDDEFTFTVYLEATNADDIVRTGTGTPTPFEPTNNAFRFYGDLVTLTDVNVTADANSAGQAETDADGLAIDDWFYDYTADVSAGDHFSTVTGVISESYPYMAIEPRSADDLVP